MVENLNAKGQKVDIKLAAMSLNWGMPKDEKFISWLGEVKEAGFDGITGFAHYDLKPFINRPNDLKSLLDERGLSLAAVDVMVYEDLDEYTPIFEFMQSLNCKLLACIVKTKNKDYKKYSELINQIGEKAKQYQIYAHFHNNTGSVGENFSDVEKVIAGLDLNKVSLMLDVGHATKDFLEFPYKERAVRFLEKYWDKIHYLEFKDWSQSLDLNVPLGEGEADYERIFSMIRNFGYKGWITFEQNSQDQWSLNRSPLTCAKLSREFIRNNLGI